MASRQEPEIHSGEKIARPIGRLRAGAILSEIFTGTIFGWGQVQRPILSFEQANESTPLVFYEFVAQVRIAGTSVHRFRGADSEPRLSLTDFFRILTREKPNGFLMQLFAGDAAA